MFRIDNIGPTSLTNLQACLSCFAPSDGGGYWVNG